MGKKGRRKSGKKGKHASGNKNAGKGRQAADVLDARIFALSCPSTYRIVKRGRLDICLYQAFPVMSFYPWQDVRLHLSFPASCLPTFIAK